MAVTTNNPFNIRYNERNNWTGQVGKYNGFCVFRNEFFGIRAMHKILETYKKKGIVTVEAVISRFAPPTENNTEHYIAYVCAELGCSRDYDILSCGASIVLLMSYMARFESNSIIEPMEIVSMLSKFEEYKLF